MASPLVSIIIPLYNNERYVEECLESCFSQSYHNIEVIVVDDGSRDNSMAVAKDTFSRWNGQYQLIHQENAGAAAARNNGFRHSKGEYVLFLDSDDILDSHKIENQIHQLAQSQFDSEVLVFGDCIGLESKTDLIDKRLCHQPLRSTELLTLLFMEHLCIYVHCYLTHRILVEKAGLWDEKLSLDDDGEFYARVIMQASSIVYSKDAVCYYRQGTVGSISKGLSAKSMNSLVRATISKALLLLNADNSKAARDAIYELCTYKFNFYYPYYSQQRKQMETFIQDNIPEYKVKHPKRSIREWCYYGLVCIGLKTSQFLK